MVIILCFWVLVFLILYTYFFYPILLIFINKFYDFKKYKINKDLNIDFVILAYNEEKVIDWKINNSLEALTEFKNSKLWIISDGSSDKTVEIVNQHLHNPKIRLLKLKRSGKSQAINKAMKELSGDIVVFSDANIEYNSKTILELVSPFSDTSVGCSCGKLVFKNPGKVVSGEGESFYWKYENLLKKLESKIGYVSGATGAVYAIRRTLFKDLPLNCINDDFTISMNVVDQGFKCLYAENAIVYENVAPSVESEFKRHIRDATGHYISIFHLSGLLNIFRGMSSYIFWSHRIIRWSVPLILFAVFFLNYFLIANVEYLILFSIQIIFYALAILGLFFYRFKNIPFIIFAPFYFCNLNLALLLGLFNALFFKQKGMWESTERS
jgi:poly-beta-1,6-N-acetyl-D-glucosamine synthase